MHIEVYNNMGVLQTGLVGPAGLPGADGSMPTFSGLNVDVVDFPAGAPIAKDPNTSTGILLACAANNTLQPIGLAQVAIAVGFTGLVQLEGPMTLADWTAVTGTTNLVPNGRYLLSTVAGKVILPPAPAGAGNLIAELGRAAGNNLMGIQIRILGKRAS